MLLICPDFEQKVRTSLEEACNQDKLTMVELKAKLISAGWLNCPCNYLCQTTRR